MLALKSLFAELVACRGQVWEFMNVFLNDRINESRSFHWASVGINNGMFPFCTVGVRTIQFWFFEFPSSQMRVSHVSMRILDLQRDGLAAQNHDLDRSLFAIPDSPMTQNVCDYRPYALPTRRMHYLWRTISLRGQESFERVLACRLPTWTTWPQR